MDGNSMKEGSVVQLRSGGPKMTVNWISAEGGVTSAYCEWFVDDNPPWKRDGSVFPLTSLVVVEH